MAKTTLTNALNQREINLILDGDVLSKSQYYRVRTELGYYRSLSDIVTDNGQLEPWMDGERETAQLVQCLGCDCDISEEDLELVYYGETV